MTWSIIEVQSGCYKFRTLPQKESNVWWSQECSSSSWWYGKDIWQYVRSIQMRSRSFTFISDKFVLIWGHFRCVWGKKTVGFSYNKFVLSGGHIMSLRWQKLIDSSTHILNLIVGYLIFVQNLLLSCSVVFSSLFKGVKFCTFISVVIWKGQVFVLFCKM